MTIKLTDDKGRTVIISTSELSSEPGVLRLDFFSVERVAHPSRCTLTSIINLADADRRLLIAALGGC